jgi:hypothetical protein
MSEFPSEFPREPIREPVREPPVVAPSAPAGTPAGVPAAERRPAAGFPRARSRRRGALAVAAVGGAVWLAAAVVRRAPAADALGATPAARLAALDRALPQGTRLDRARAFLHARDLSFAQDPGGTLRVMLPGGVGPRGDSLPPARLVLEFDASRRLVGRRLEP